MSYGHHDIGTLYFQLIYGPAGRLVSVKELHLAVFDHCQDGAFTYEASTYHYHTDQTIKTLRATATNKAPFEIKEPGKLKDFAARLGIDTSGSESRIAIRLCDFAEADFNRKYYEPSQTVEILAPQERKDTWRKSGIFPGGI
ncbi:unnamed protein product [marine sediment metagenome]|uniref:Uncharacterized protein n=1 Tax=marine sediment metagenome TaxID=412755 RepID=X1Q5B6_9ZZZZ